MITLEEIDDMEAKALDQLKTAQANFEKHCEMIDLMRAALLSREANKNTRN